MPGYQHSPLITPRRPSTPPTPHRTLSQSSSMAQSATHFDYSNGASPSTAPSWASSSFSGGLFSGGPTSIASTSQSSSVQWGATPSLLPASIQWGSNTSFSGSTCASNSALATSYDPFTPQALVTPPPDRHRKSESKRKRFEDEDEDEEMGSVTHRNSPSRERDSEHRAFAGRRLIPKRIRAGIGVAACIDVGDREGNNSSSSGGESAGHPTHGALFCDRFGEAATGGRDTNSNRELGTVSRTNTHTERDGSSNHLDLGKMLTSLDKSRLLSLLSSLLSLHPHLASTMHSLIPTPTLESVHQSLDAYEASIKQALPFGHEPNRPEYAWSRLKGPVAEMVGDIQGWMEFFKAKQEETSAQNEGVHPNTMFSLLFYITARAVKIQRDYLPPVPAIADVVGSSNADASPWIDSSSSAARMLASLPSSVTAPHSPNVLATVLLPLLLGAWDALLGRISHDVNGLGKMFGREIVAGWLRGLEQLVRECASCQRRERSSAAEDNEGSSYVESTEETAETLRAVRASVQGLDEGFRREIGWVVSVF